MKALILATLVCSLAACNLTGNVQQQEELGCTAVAATYQVLTIANQHGKLTAVDKQAVMDKESLIDGVCKSPTPLTAAQLKALGYQDAVAFITTLAARVK